MALALRLIDETNVKLTPTYLRKVADGVNNDKIVTFQKTVMECVNDNIVEIDSNLLRIAKTGAYEMNSPINICDKKYTDKIGEFDIDEFEKEVTKTLREIYVKKGFDVPELQSNYFKLGW